MSGVTEICSAKGCQQDAGWALLWNNPKLHTPERRKVWLACEDHRQSLSDFLGARGFLLEAVAHDNVFNRWVAKDAAVYFSETDGCGRALRAVVDDAGLRARLQENARRRHAEAFTWDAVLAAYERVIAG